MTMAELTFLPNTVEYKTGAFVNPQGLRLQSYCFQASQQRPRAVAFMCHGYTSHTTFEWLVASEPGGVHDCWDGSVLQGLVEAGFVVHALDQQGHGLSEGARGLRCFFEHFCDLPAENEAYIREVVLKDSQTHGLPVFLFGISMGGAVAVQMARSAPDLYRGMVLYAPMLCLNENLRQGVPRVAKLIAGFVDRLHPTMVLPGSSPDKLPKVSMQEKEADPLTYKGGLRLRVVKEFVEVTEDFLASGLASVRVPFLVAHAVSDPMTDYFGSQTLFERAACSDKAFLRIGPGYDIDADMCHALSWEPGHDLVFAPALKWLLERIPDPSKL